MRGRGPRHRRVPNYVAVEKVGCRHEKLLGERWRHLCARAGGGVPRWVPPSGSEEDERPRELREEGGFGRIGMELGYRDE